MKLRLDRQEARRQGAADRFKIMPFNEWAKTPGKASENEQAKSYGAYRERKLVEARALGILAAVAA